MAELQMKLKQYEKAERTVAQALDAENNGSQRSNDLNSLMTQVEINQLLYLVSSLLAKPFVDNDMEHQSGSYFLIFQARYYTLLAQIQERAGSLEAAMRTLSEAKDIRARLLKRVQIEQPDAVEEQVVIIIKK